MVSSVDVVDVPSVDVVDFRMKSSVGWLLTIAFETEPLSMTPYVSYSNSVFTSCFLILHTAHSSSLISTNLASSWLKLGTAKIFTVAADRPCCLALKWFDIPTGIRCCLCMALVSSKGEVPLDVRV